MMFGIDLQFMLLYATGSSILGKEFNEFSSTRKTNLPLQRSLYSDKIEFTRSTLVLSIRATGAVVRVCVGDLGSKLGTDASCLLVQSAHQGIRH